MNVKQKVCYYNNVCKFYLNRRLRRKLKFAQSWGLATKHMRARRVRNLLLRSKLSYRKIFYGLHSFYTSFLRSFTPSVLHSFLVGQIVIVGGGNTLLEQVKVFRKQLNELGLLCSMVAYRDYAYLRRVNCGFFLNSSLFRGGYIFVIYGKQEFLLFMMCHASVLRLGGQMDFFYPFASGMRNNGNFLNYFGTIYKTLYYKPCGSVAVDFVWVYKILFGQQTLFKAFCAVLIPLSILFKSLNSQSIEVVSGDLLLNSIFLKTLCYSYYFIINVKMHLVLGGYKVSLL